MCVNTDTWLLWWPPLLFQVLASKPVFISIFTQSVMVCPIGGKDRLPEYVKKTFVRGPIAAEARTLRSQIMN
eukprot:505572-Amphidinium_carterae.8